MKTERKEMEKEREEEAPVGHTQGTSLMTLLAFSRLFVYYLPFTVTIKQQEV